MPEGKDQEHSRPKYDAMLRKVSVAGCFLQYAHALIPVFLQRLHMARDLYG